MKFDSIVKKILISEKYYETRKDVKGYVDANELIGKRLWVHTNRTHMRNKWNGMVGIYGVNSKGKRTGSPLYYTNEIRIKSPIFFEVDPLCVDRIVESEKRDLCAGVSGTVIETEGDLSGFEEITIIPPKGDKHFYKKNDPEKKKIIDASEVYFVAEEDGTYHLLAKNIVIGNNKDKY
jgi:hypothetical protein